MKKDARSSATPRRDVQQHGQIITVSTSKLTACSVLVGQFVGRDG